MVCLIKPQFEAGRDKVGKKGVVRDPAVHREVIRRVTDMAAAEGFILLGLTWSPIRGPEGNIEYLMYLEKPLSGSEPVPPADRIVPDKAIEALVGESHQALEHGA